MLRCPYTGSPLVAEGDALLTADGRRYRVVDGIPWVLDETQVSALDREFQRQYTERDAKRYDRAVKLLILALGCWEPCERRRMVDLLDLSPGAAVLEVSVGTGANLPFIVKKTGPEGRIVALDLSVGMMGVARARAARLPTPTAFVRGDAVYLPFADATFDAVFHFGGLNMFGDRAQALTEMVRVAKPGVVVVVGDEGPSERRRRSWLGRRLLRMNNLYLFRPPLALLPWSRIEDFQLHWAWRELFYLMRFRVAGGPPRPNPEEELRRRLSRQSC